MADLKDISNQAGQILRENNLASHSLHRQFLRLRQGGLAGLAELVEEGLVADNAAPAVLFTRQQLEEFATGSVAKVFGAAFSRYERQRHPRIPNGNLLMMTRVVSIDGRRGQLDRPANITAEFDAPADAWFYQGDGAIPCALWMEIALQPCGFLSAWLGTALKFPEIEYFFRNLDGRATLHRDVDARGKKVTTRAQLVSSSASGTTIIQKFTFVCACGDEVIYSGESVFGFFPPMAMAAQAGLDGGKAAPFPQAVAWLDLAGPRGQLRLLDRVAFLPGEGADQALVLGVRANRPQDWFYACHFHQDPVMPGSLGVEAAIQALREYSAQSALPENTINLRNPRIDLAGGRELTWKYRGQILPSHREMRVAVRVGQPERVGREVILPASASIWADEVRIYEIDGLGIRMGHVRDRFS